MKRKILSIIFALLLMIPAVASAEFFADVIVTSPHGIWTDSRAYTTLNAAVAAVGLNYREIVIVNEQTVVNLEVPPNVRLKFLRDGSIKNSGQLTINTRDITAGDQRIFTGTGDIDFVVGSTVRSAWFSNIVEALDVTSDDYLTLIISDAEFVTSNCSVGNNVNLKWEASRNQLTINGGIELSNIGQIEAGDYQLFAGAGDFDFLDGTVLNLSWFRRLRSVVGWVEAEEVTLIVDSSSAVDYDNTTPANLSIKVLMGGDLTVAAGRTLTVNGPMELAGAIAGAGDFATGVASNLRCVGGTIGLDSTINGPFEAGLYQVFSGTGNVVLVNKDVWVEWWGLNAVALQAAINSTGSAVSGAFVNIGYSIVDIGADTVILKQGTIIKGQSSAIENLSVITMNDGSISFGTYLGSSRMKTLENLRIINSGTTSATVDLSTLTGVDGPYNNTIKNCYITGGQEAIKIDGAVWTNIENTLIINNSATSYTVYASKTNYINTVNILNSWMVGKAYFDISRTLNLKGSIFESNFDPAVQVVATFGGSINGSYFEERGIGAITLLDIDSGANGLSILGSLFNTSGVPITCDGIAVVIEGNFFDGPVGTNIDLEGNSRRCKVGPNRDGNVGTAYPTTIDAGLYNQVYGSSKDIFIPVTQMLSWETVGNALNPCVDNDGLPYVSWPAQAGGKESSIQYIFRIPPEVVANRNGDVRIDANLVYRASSAHGGSAFNTRSNIVSFSIDDAPPAAGLTVVNHTTPPQTITKSGAIISTLVITGDAYLNIQVVRAAGDYGADNYADPIYVYGVIISPTAIAY